MRAGERQKSRWELDEQARAARRCLEDAQRVLGPERPRLTLADWLRSIIRVDLSRRSDRDGCH